MELMKGSTSVQQWNDNRDIVIGNVSESEWGKLRYEIDGLGLIVEVLGADNAHQYRR
jgi:hypothetical protein